MFELRPRGRFCVLPLFGLVLNAFAELPHLVRATVDLISNLSPDLLRTLASLRFSAPRYPLSQLSVSSSLCMSSEVIFKSVTLVSVTLTV